MLCLNSWEAGASLMETEKCWAGAYMGVTVGGKVGGDEGEETVVSMKNK